LIPSFLVPIHDESGRGEAKVEEVASAMRESTDPGKYAILFGQSQTIRIHDWWECEGKSLEWWKEGSPLTRRTTCTNLSRKHPVYANDLP